MRIISRFHDYYDCMQGLYRDDMIYVRNMVEVKKPERQYNRRSYYVTVPRPYGLRKYKTRTLTEGWYYEKYSIGFCGKIYTCFKIEPKRDMFKTTPESKFCYSLEDFKQYYPNESNELCEAFGPKNVMYGEQWVDWTKPQQSEAILKKFIDNKCPIFVDYIDRIVYNDCLKNFNFQRVFDPSLAYQEIMMFFGSALAAPEKQIPVIDDKTMAQAKGFDKYSFRKDKQV